jgi:hypothetical protein
LSANCVGIGGHCVINIIGNGNVAENLKARGDKLMARQWHEVHQEVAKWLSLRSTDRSLPPLWQQVFAEMHKRWLERQDIVQGLPNKEVTIKIGVSSEELADRAMQRINEFVTQFGTYETDNLRVVLIGQKYRRDNDISVLLRVRIVPKTTKQRSKFEVTDASQI